MVTACEASEAKPAGKAVVGGAQRRVCRWETQICKGEASLRGRGASRPWRKAGVQGAGPRAPSASRASTNLTQGGTCPGGPRAAVAPHPHPHPPCRETCGSPVPRAGLYLGTGSHRCDR